MKETGSDLFLVFQYGTAALSIMCWMVVFTPQLYSNYLRKSGDSLSLVFLYIWLVADLCSIAGILLDGLAWTLFALAIYYTIADTLLIWQVYYYRNFYPSRLHDEQLLQNDNADESRPLLHDEKLKRKGSSSFNGSISPLILISLMLHVASSAPVIYSAMFSSQSLNAAEEKTESLDLSSSATFDSLLTFLGQNKAAIFGYLSAVLYIGSRIPQIIKNAVEKSCEGLSLLMFCLAVFGNVMYVASIIFEYLYKLDEELLIKNIPYIAGSTGTMIFDIIIFVQFYWYDTESSSSSFEPFEQENYEHGKDDGEAEFLIHGQQGSGDTEKEE